MEDGGVILARFDERFEGGDRLGRYLGEELEGDIAVVGMQNGNLFTLLGSFLLVFRVSRVEIGSGDIVDVDQLFDRLGFISDGLRCGFGGGVALLSSGFGCAGADDLLTARAAITSMLKITAKIRFMVFPFCRGKTPQALKSAYLCFAVPIYCNIIAVVFQ